MKQKLITRLILAGLAGAAVTGAFAGQIQASSVSIAREVITTDTQAVTAPSISYRFAGDVDARAQAQTFQVQFTLEQGAWDALPAALANQINVTDGVTAAVMVLNTDYTIVQTGRSADNKTLWATITVPQGATRLIKQPLITLNTVAGGAPNVLADRARVTGLKTVVGDVQGDFDASGVCAAVRTARVGFKHYVGLQNPTAIASDATATADEHTRSGATNSATLMTFPTNLGVKFAASTGTLKLQSGGNMFFDSTGAGAVVASAWPSTAGTAHVLAGAANQATARLGIARLTQEAAGLDSDVTNGYALNNTGGPTQAATATVNNGEVEIASVDLRVSATNGFVTGGTLFLAAAGANCAAALPNPDASVAITAANAAGPITLKINTAGAVAALGAAGTFPVEVCYTAPTTATIPSSAFSVVGTIVKSAAGGNFAEQNNRCNGNLFSLGGGLKIDVRNYASSKEQSGYMSVLRFVNNSDTRTADVWAQIIHQDGKLGNWAKLTDLAPRAVLNMTAAQIDAVLATGNAPAAANAAANGPGAAVHVGGNATRSDTAPRLRITSTAGSTLRVQNYLFNSATGQILEGSGAQAVDFEGTGDRAPASEGQYQSQDANSGLNLK